MESSLRESLNQIRSCRLETLEKQQLVSLQCGNQFNEMHDPFRLNSEQHLESLSWIPNSNSQHMVLPEDSNLLIHKDVEGSASSSFGSYASYLGTSTKTDISNPGQENGVLSHLSSTTPLRVQLGGQFPYLPYSLNLLNDTKFQPAAEIIPHENSVDYQVNGSFEAHGPGYDTNHPGWASTSGPCAVTVFDEHMFAQASFPQVNYGFT